MTQAEPAALSVTDSEDVEGLGQPDNDSWGDYPLDELLIRNEVRTIDGVIRRINQGTYVMNPDFQRDFIWPELKQSRLIESVIMRIPLPVFYLAENDEGKMVVVDGLQRLSTFQRFLENKLKLKLPRRKDIHQSRFEDLSPKLRNRIEDFNLIFYIIDPKIPECAQLDIFERVNDSVPLTRQQMRNCLYMGKSTEFLKSESESEIFLKATGNSLNRKKMRDREFINRFCAFQLLGHQNYPGDMDEFLANCLKEMNEMDNSAFSKLSCEFRWGLDNNYMLFGCHSFRKHKPNQKHRNPINASLWDVMCTGLSRIRKDQVKAHKVPLRQAIYGLLADKDFNAAITSGTSSARNVMLRFQAAQLAIKEVFDAETT